MELTSIRRYHTTNTKGNFQLIPPYHFGLLKDRAKYGMLVREVDKDSAIRMVVEKAREVFHARIAGKKRELAELEATYQAFLSQNSES